MPMFVADPRGILALIAVAMCWALAVVLFRVGNPGSVARKLSLLLIIEGVTLGSSSSVDFLLASPADFWAGYPGLSSAGMLVHTIGDCGMLLLYPPFLAAALRIPLTHPFANTRVQIALAGVSVALVFLVMLTPLQIGGTLLYVALLLVFGFALVASIQAWRAASGATRTKARMFVLAFGFRDVCWGFVYGIAVWELWTGTYTFVADPVPLRYFFYMLGTLTAVPLLTYGILRNQLFDIDLRIRWTIKQSTLAAAILSIIFLISEAASQFLSAELGNVLGLLAAAVLMFFLAPLQRFAERVATVAMPRTQDTPAYVAYRKMQVYEAAVTEAQQDGGISHKERALLARLRDSLGITESDANAIEQDLKAD